jgi:short-subunit dehydrogenase
MEGTTQMAAFPLRGATVVITGAASGIGAALAANLAARGAHLALADRNAAGLAAVATKARDHGVKVSEHVLDVSDRAALEALPEAVLAEHDRVTVLVNNAGVALAGDFADVTMADFEWLFDINFWAPVRLTKAFMYALTREPAAHHRAGGPKRVQRRQIRRSRLFRSPAPRAGRHQPLAHRGPSRRHPHGNRQ